MATYSNKQQAPQGVSINNQRRTFEFGDRVAELAPEQSPFFVYLSKVAKKPTSDPVFKFMEQRHQWQRRSFNIKGAVSAANYTNGTEVTDAMILDTTIDKFGRTVATPVVPEWILVGQIIAVKDTGGVVRHFRVSGVDKSSGGGTADQVDLVPLFTASSKAFADNAAGIVVGTAHAEGGQAPTSWSDELYDREGYCQIFKTSIDLFSNTARATEYRGISNEYMRIWQTKLMEHKMDIENAMLFGTGAASEGAGTPLRYSWGIVPYTETYGKTKSFTYANSDYDDIVDAMEDVFHPESGNSGKKLVLASRKVIGFFNKLNSGTFLGNTVGASQYKLNLAEVPGQFGHNVTQVSTIFGDLMLVQEPLFKGPYEDTAIMVDLANVAYRPLAGNGVSRDTQIMTNIQNNDVDGRQDMVLTEAGLEISLPETHTLLSFS